MGVETDNELARAIREHLDLKERNSSLENAMPLDRYEPDDPFENHPLFKSEEQAKIEETMDGTEPVPVTGGPALPWPGENGETDVEGPALDESLWGRSRDFDWGD